MCTLERVTYRFDDMKNVENFRKTIHKRNQQSAIYLMTHKDTDRQYVGSAFNLRSRLDDYFQPARLEKIANKNIIIVRALMKYGYSAFTMEIMFCEVESREMLLLIEQFYLDNYPLEFNQRRDATGGYTPRTGNIVPVYVYHENVLVQYFLSGTEWRDSYNSDSQTIQKYLNSDQLYQGTLLLRSTPINDSDRDKISSLLPFYRPHFSTVQPNNIRI